jgi:hypothetical protein
MPVYGKSLVLKLLNLNYLFIKVQSMINTFIHPYNFLF